ncbi:MAG: LysR family transcriptional regulator [Rickettsiales bacterium]|nr:LysR family transcriptional regulator [Rickettsiales bacterium]
MDRIESMQIFLKTLEKGSISAASRDIGMPLATVSRKISELESHLGMRLLNRSTRKLSLTDAGQSYMVACKRILEDLETTERAVSGEYRAPKGDLIITAPVLFGQLHILPIATEFLKAYPDINLRFLLTDRYVNLIEEHVDVALRIGDLPDSRMVATRVGAIKQVVCASPAYLAARGTPTTPQELSAHDCVTFERLASPKNWIFGRGKSSVSVAIHSRLIVTTAEAAVSAAVAGIGITRALSYQVANVPASKLVMILSEYESPAAAVSLIHLGGQFLPLKIRAFLDFTTPRLKARFSGVETVSDD